MLDSDLQHSVFWAINGAMFGTRCEPLPRPSEVGMAVVIMAIEGLVALSLVAALWPEMRRATLLTDTS